MAGAASVLIALAPCHLIAVEFWAAGYSALVASESRSSAMSDRVRLEWQHEPPDYFEEPLSFDIEDIHVDIADGRIVAALPATTYDQNEQIADGVRNRLEYRFLGAQLVNDSPYKLSGPRMTRIDTQGTEHRVILLTAGSCTIVGHPIDLKVTDIDGNVTADTRAAAAPLDSDRPTLTSAREGATMPGATRSLGENCLGGGNSG
jgi:hypothetical protein